MMTLEQATTIVYDEAAHQGEPLTRDVCAQIVMKLFGVSVLAAGEPGDIAKFHRQRYERSEPS